jgi:hypothetical protein
MNSAKQQAAGLAYENATSGVGALREIEKTLGQLGCQRFGTMTDHERGEILVQFSLRGRDLSVRASFRGYAAAWLKAHPFGPHRRGTRAEHEAKALRQAQLSVCSILRDWIKGQAMAVECGVLSVDGAFLGQILLPSGRTVLEEVAQRELLALA